MHSRVDWGIRVALLALLAFTLLTGPANASVVIPPADDDLIVRADAVILGRVTDIESHDTQQGKLHTYITLAIDEVLKGTLAQPTLTIRELGGQVGGFGGWVFANPEFTVGEQVLLFLSQRDDGTLRVLHFYLGKFSVMTDPASGDLVAVRPLPDEVAVIAPPGAATSGIALGAVGRGLDDFKARILEKAGEPRPLMTRPSPGLQLSSARRPAGGIVERHQDFRFLRDPNPPTATNPSLVQPRFSQPDSNTPIVMHFNTSGEPLAPMDSDGGREPVRAAFRAWSRVPTTSFRFVEGPVTTTHGFNNDSVNTVSFRDPDGDIDPPTISPLGCGGVLAVGGMFFSPTASMTVNGRQFSQAFEADLVFADGWETCTSLPGGGYYQSFANLAEVATHELGHALGLGHSEVTTVDPISGLDGATMEPTAHFDGRTAGLHADDKAGVTFIYPGRTLTIQKTGAGGGTVTSGTGNVGAGINCGPDCVAGFAFNSIVTLTVTPAGSATFLGFVEAGCGPTVTMTSDRTCTANFTTDPDLVISATSGPAVAAPGTNIVLNNTVRNNGLPAGSFTVGLYLATSASVTQADRQLTTRSVAGLSTNATSADATSVLIPSDVTPGNYFLGAIADINGEVTEGNESNNASSTPIIIAKPDLVVTALTAPATAGAGQTITVNSTVKNQATAAISAGASTLAFYLSPDAIVDPGDVRLSATRAIGALAKDATSAGATSLTIPANTAAGTYFLIAMADDLGVVDELNESNNTRSVSIAISRPDLSMLTVTATPAVAAAGMNVSVTQTVKNVATAPANAPASISRLTLSSNTTLGDGDDVDLGTVAIPALTAGAQAVVTKSVVLPPGTAPHLYWIFARANDGDAIPEGGQGSANNAARTATPITIGPDLLVSTATAAPTAIAPGGTVNVANVVKNQGGPNALAFDVGFYLSTNTAFDAGSDILLATRRVTTALAAGASTPSVITPVTIPANTSAGTYFVVVRADAGGVQPAGEVLEVNELNNVLATVAIQVVKPDLAVQSVTATPAVLMSGANVSVTHVVKNLALAPGAAGASTSRLYLSSDQTLDEASDLVLGDVTVGPLAGGAMATVTKSVQIPGGLAEGQYWIFARANVGDAIPEGGLGSGNNAARTATSILVGPDLVVSAATATPVTTAPGLTVSVNHTVKNQGGQAAGPFDVGIYLSSNNAFDAGQDLLLNTRRVAAGLAPAATSMAVLPVVIPTNQSAGSYFLLVRADISGAGSGVVTEANEVNNLLAVPLTIARADLKVMSVTVPAVAAAGANVSVTHVVKNQAPAPGSAPTTTSRLYLSTDGTLDGGDVPLGDVTVGPLAAGAMAAVTKSVVIPPGTTPGRYVVIAQANATGTVVEADGSNNLKVSTPIIVGPDLVVSAATAAPIAAAPGATVNVTNTVKNQGGAGAGSFTVGVYLSNDNVFDVGDTLLNSRAVLSLTAGAMSGPLVTPVVIPSNQSSGSYYLIVRADSTDAVVEADETHNGVAVALTVVRPDLTVQSVTATPAAVAPGANVSVTHVVKNAAPPAGAAGTSTSRLYLSTDATLDDPGDTVLGDASVVALAGGTMATVTRSLPIPVGTAPGKYWIIARANATNSVIESESPAQLPNVKATPIVIGPDVLPTAASTVATATPGMNVSVMYTLKNQGGQIASNFDVGFALVPQPSGADIPIGPSRTGVTLNAGATSALTNSVAIPASTALGTYKIKVTADASGTVTEADEGNNTFLTGVLTVLRPDLTVPTVTFTPAAIAPGANITVTHVVKNLALAPGNAPLSASRLLLSTNQSAAGQVADLGTANVPAVTAGGMTTVTRSATVPLGLAPGFYYVLARADDLDAIVEPNSANNLGFSATRLIVGPDLTVTTASTVAGAIPGANVSVSYTLKNLGAASSPFNVDFTLVPVSAGPDIPIGPTRTAVVLAGGGTLATSSTVQVPSSVAAGQYRVRVTADPADVIVEALETNNAATTGIMTVTPPELSISSLTVPGIGIAGRNLGIANAVLNSAAAPGTAPSFQVGLYLATSATIDPASDTLLASRTVATLAPGATSAATTSVMLPTTPGNYFIGAVADRNAAVVEANEGNNQQASAITVVPSMLRAATHAFAQSTLSNCAIGANNGTSNLNGTMSVPTQTGASWAGTLSLPPNTLTVSGSVDVAGALSGSFTVVNGAARGSGSFTGTVTPSPSGGPGAVSATFSGAFNVGEICTISGTFSSP